MLARMDCCDPNGLDRMFAGRLVRQELNAWRRKGLNGRQRSIIEPLAPLAPGTTVLEVGCGIGAVGTTLLTKGAGEGTFVDISMAYLRAAREAAAQAGVEARASFHQDDFATSKHPYPEADVVVLDRVVCCYPDAVALLEKAARHSRQTLIFTYPRPFWFMPLFRTLCALGMRLAGREYRFFLHDPELLLRAATGAGHSHVVTRSVGVWQLVKVSRGQETVDPLGCVNSSKEWA
jgi:SAM-dependent methyltransferase